MIFDRRIKIAPRDALPLAHFKIAVNISHLRESKGDATHVKYLE